MVSRLTASVGAAFIPNNKKAPSPFSASANVIDLALNVPITGDLHDFYVTLVYELIHAFGAVPVSAVRYFCSQLLGEVQ